MLKRTLRVLTAAALAAAGTTVLSAQAASADTITNLIGAYDANGGVVADGVHQRLFIANSSDDGLVTTDLIGRNVKRVDGPVRAAALALSADSSRLYAAVPGDDAIVALDTSTLTQVAKYPLGVAPLTLARSGDTLWFGYRQDVNSTVAGLGRLDLAGADHTVTTLPQLAGRDVRQPPMVAVSPANPNLVATVETQTNPSVVRLYDFSGGAATLVADRTTYSSINSLLFTPDGTGLLEDGANQAAEELSSTDLSTVREYPVGALPARVTVADDGTIAVGRQLPSSQISLFRPGNPEPITTLSLSRTGYGYANARIGAMAFEPGSERVIVVAPSDDQVASVQVLNDERPKAPTTVTINVPSTVYGTDRFAINVVVTSTVSGVTTPVAGAPVRLTRTDATYGTTQGEVGTTAADGTYQFLASAQMIGTITYTVRTPVDSVHAAASATATVQAVKRPTTLTIDHNNATYNYGTTVVFTAHLGSTYAERTVAIYADPAGADQANKLVRSAWVDASGNLTAGVKLTRDTTVSAVFAGDDYTQPVTVKSVVLTRAGVSSSLTRQYKTASSVAYFHSKINPYVTTTMNAFPGRKQYLTIEYYSGGKWHLVKAAYYALNSSGKSYVTFTGTHKLNVKYRVRAAYLSGKSGDTGNVTTYGAYKYFIFTK